jgi:hypothetical protein
LLTPSPPPRAQAAALASVNPQVAARLLTAFGAAPRLDAPRRAAAADALAPLRDSPVAGVAEQASSVLAALAAAPPPAP